MSRKITGKLFAPVFLIAVLAMMLFLRPDPSLTSGQLTSINGVFLSDEWIEESNISQAIKDQTDGLPPVQQSVFMRRMADEEPFHVVYLSGETFAEETGIQRITGDSYPDEEDPDDHDDPYAKGLTTFTPDEEDLLQADWEEYQASEWSEFPVWVQGLNETVEAHYETQGIMDVTTIHPEEVARVIEYTQRVEEFRRVEQDEVHQNEVDEALSSDEPPPADLDHGPMPVYPEITRDVRRMAPDVVVLDMHLILDHIEQGKFRVANVRGFSPDDILDQTYDFLNNLHRGNIDHFTTYVLFSDDIRYRLGLGEQSTLADDLDNLSSQFRIYEDRQIVHFIEISAYEELRPSWWATSQISPLLIGR